MRSEGTRGERARLRVVPAFRVARQGLALAAAVLAVVVLTALAPAPAAAHEAATTVRAHIEEDSVIHDPAEERRLGRHTSMATATDAAAAAAQVTGGPGEVGEWGPVVDWPVVGVHVALLENGKVLAYDSVGDHATETYPVHDFTRATVWDPATGVQTPVNVATGFNIFCSGLAHLMDGNLFIAGGGRSSADARVIDLTAPTPQVSATAPLETGRRQFNLTVLADGTVLATGGNSSGAQLVSLANGVYTAELWDPDTGDWSTLASMQVTRQNHSTALLLPDGRVLSAGGGICGICDSVGYLAKNAEVFSPPYLFKKNGSGELAGRLR